ncbi:MAG: hypothetical protein K2W82_04420 [Candidatus Obscuribacterales bacterium]|nr:hypothetical protein [Candidatus Obscuribacterales bacterium]
MFKQPKSSNPNQSNQPARQRLPLLEREPQQDDVASLFTGALRIKGTLFELPIKPGPFTSTYLVTCEYDTTTNTTIWAMYEGEEGSTVLWNGPQNDLDLVFDMICMSCQQKVQTQLPPEVTSDKIPPAPSQPQTTNYEELSVSGPEINNFIDLLNKGQPNLLLGHLFVEAGMVPERCLDTALKLQEMVRKGKLNNEEAILALKRTAASGGELNDELIDGVKNLDSTWSEKQTAKSAACSQAKSTASKDNPAMDKLIDILKQSSLITEADIESAKKVRAKHGGELGAILVSAGKISGKTLEAAAHCQEYVQHKRLRIDQAIMSLLYCERTRSTLKDALDELGIELA